MISSLGVDCCDSVMERCFFKGQGRATVDAGIIAQGAATRQHILNVSERLKLVTLHEVVNLIKKHSRSPDADMKTVCSQSTLHDDVVTTIVRAQHRMTMDPRAMQLERHLLERGALPLLRTATLRVL